jgi:hypothetical protein
MADNASVITKMRDDATFRADVINDPDGTLAANNFEVTDAFRDALTKLTPESADAMLAIKKKNSTGGGETCT